MKTIKKRMRLVVLIAIVAISTSCSKPTEGTVVLGHEITVDVATVTQKEMVQNITGYGLISSETEAILSFKVGGIIQSILVQEGQKVKKGQLLARLDVTEIEAQVIQARNGFEKARRDLNRVKRLYQDDAATLENVQDLTTAFNVAKESLRIAEFNLKFAEIRAISDGTIVSKMKNEGELVTPGAPIFFMNDTSDDKWKVEIGLADKDWVKLNEGDLATVEVDAYPGEKFEGQVMRLAQGADPTNGSYQVEVNINPEGKKFAVGLFAKATIIPSTKERYHVMPIESLVEGFGKNGFVFIPHQDTAVRKIPVQIAFITPSEAVIAQGLEGIEKVIKGGSGYLTEKSKIRIQKDPRVATN
ncbi:MAG: efflux RND transporter periplasmic adaptor subunit [Bacteroidota bacterium]